ncbi:MAG: hypothetical protein ACREQX_14255 [Candidatus Binataceae bacterium]
MVVKQQLMNRTSMVLAIALALGLGAGSTLAYAHGHGPHGGWLGPLGAIIQPNQRQQIHSMLSGEKQKMETLHQNVRNAKAALIGKLLSSDQSVDVSSELIALQQAEAALLQERVNVAQQVRVVLAPQQRAQALQLWTKLESLHQQERELFQQARQASQTSQTQ